MTAEAPSGDLLVHGTCVAISGRAALLRGAPGSGKSDLALRFISAFGGTHPLTEAAVLISDDQVVIARQGDAVAARAPDTISGLLEVRGIGITEVVHAEDAKLVLIVDMAKSIEVPRLPPAPLPSETILGVAIPILKLDPFEQSCPVKLKLALTGSL